MEVVFHSVLQLERWPLRKKTSDGILISDYVFVLATGIRVMSFWATCHFWLMQSLLSFPRKLDWHPWVHLMRTSRNSQRLVCENEHLNTLRIRNDFLETTKMCFVFFPVCCNSISMESAGCFVFSTVLFLHH